MNKLKLLFIVTLAGTLFSGYLSAVKLFSNSCAFGETCPYFLGFPACWYGFVLFLFSFANICIALAKPPRARKAVITTLVAALAGVLFSGQFVVEEIVNSTVTGALGLSTCAYGLVFFVLVLIVAVMFLREKPLVDTSS